MKPDPQSVVRALELTLERHSNVEWKAGDAAILHAALAVARSMVEQWEELVDTKAALEWLRDNERHVLFRAVENCLDCPDIIKRYLGDKV